MFFLLVLACSCARVIVQHGSADPELLLWINSHLQAAAKLFFFCVVLVFF